METILRASKDESGKISWQTINELMPFYGEIALGNATQYTIAAFWFTPGDLFVAIEGKGAYSFSNFVDWSYAAEKLGLEFESDARNFSDWINTQLGLIGDKNQGEYRDSLINI
jgi:hypothetical protein